VAQRYPWRGHTVDAAGTSDLDHCIPRPLSLAVTRDPAVPVGPDNSDGGRSLPVSVVDCTTRKAKEFGGTIAGRDDLVKEGQAQQDKADAQRDAGKKEAEAEAARGGAKAAEERQKEHQ
jgi:hypothetical protein